MPEFANPFGGNVPDRPMTKGELIRALRLNLAAEQEAIFLYTAHAEATDHPLAKQVLLDVANEEREHLGEFQRLLQILTGDEDEWVSHGRAEVDELAAEAGGRAAAGGAVELAPGEDVTIGSLKR